MPEISDSFVAEFRRHLSELGFETVLIGALAAARYRLAPRETTDVDLLAGSLEGLSEAMRDEGYTANAMAEPGRAPYVVFIRGKGATVDVLLAETEYQREAMKRAVDGVITAEDVIIHKLLAWRPRDRDDVESILAAGHTLDEEYIRRWSEAWQVADRWEEVVPPGVGG